MSGITSEINSYTKNKWQVRFSNLIDMTGLELDTHILDNYVKSVSIPDLSITMLTSMFQHDRQLHPNPIGSREFQTLNIEFRMDEKGKNFYYFYKWITGMRYGENVGRKSLKDEELLRFDRVDCIEVLLLNNDNVIVSKMKFKNCFPTNLGALSLEYSSAEEATFVITFDYEYLDLQPETTEE